MRLFVGDHRLIGCSDAPPIGTDSSDSTAARCVIDTPIASDGYTAFADVDAAHVTRQVVGPDGTLVVDPEAVVTPTEEQLAEAMDRIGLHVEQIRREVPAEHRRTERYAASRRGEAMAPYCLFHAPGRSIYGTVLLLHGFNDRPHQQGKLASYLFHAGFNVYNVYLANHFMVDGTEFWPKTAYRPELVETIQHKLADPAIIAMLQPLAEKLHSGQELSEEEIAVFDAAVGPELSYGLYQEAWSDPGGDAYRTIFNWHEPQPDASLMAAARKADFFQFVRDAQARLDELDSLPGPVFVGGLSVGGTLALALGAAEGGERIRGIVSHAPWLQSVLADNNMNLRIGGPLDNGDPISWPNHGVPFSAASVSANLALGAWMFRPESLANLTGVPTAIITTEAEDSADNAATAALQQLITSHDAVASLHVASAYPASFGIGHAFTDPENYAGEEAWNRHFRTLYQESYRFYLQGTVDADNLLGVDQDTALPRAACVAPDFPWRCDR